MAKNMLVAPVLKWVGGKRQLLDKLTPLMPKTFSSYCEPFVGGGAMLFSIQPKTAYINDVNEELMLVYSIIKNDVNGLIQELSTYENTSDFFYRLRDLDRDKKKYEELSDIKKAARIIYLNKTCYNGLYRVNNAGEFNTPFGNYRNPSIVNKPVLLAVSSYLNANSIIMSCGDYAPVLNGLSKGAFVYLDPPYDPVSSTASFTGYTRGGFSKDEQIRLRDHCNDLNDRGIKFMLSNSATDFIKEIYSENKSFNCKIVQAKRNVNSVGAKRGDVDEVVIRNYE